MAYETISVIGLGYIGLPTAAILADKKKRVIGVDVNKKAVDTISSGRIHIIEPELDQLVRAVVLSGHLKATLVPEAADAFLIAVPTPFKGSHEPDLSYIKAAVGAIAPVLRKGNLVILESTSPVGATEQLVSWLMQLRPDLSFPVSGAADADINVAYCPERVLPGNVLRELVSNDRIIGGVTEACSYAALELYRTFVKGECVVTSARTAEMCKLTENSFRDVNIAFANELSIICEKLKINVWELISLANRHPRVNILQPGPGVGGHCIAVDPWFIVSQVPDQARLIRIAREVNDSKPRWVLEKVWEYLGRLLSDEPAKRSTDVSIACLGLTFKPNIDDLRESPALSICQEIVSAHPGRVIVVEPHISELPASLAAYSRVSLDTLNNAILSADIIVLLVDHEEFTEAPIALINQKRLIDTRGLWSR